MVSLNTNGKLTNGNEIKKMASKVKANINPTDICLQGPPSFDSSLLNL